MTSSIEAEGGKEAGASRAKCFCLAAVEQRAVFMVSLVHLGCQYFSRLPWKGMWREVVKHKLPEVKIWRANKFDL